MHPWTKSKWEGGGTAMGRRTEGRVSLRSRVVNTCAVLVKASYEIPEWDLLIIVCHVVCYVMIIVYVWERIFVLGKMKMCELERKKMGTGQEIYSKHQTYRQACRVDNTKATN
jgi:hypothetical protein